MATDGYARQVKVFLASPGDVPDERSLARQTIDRVRSERAFRGRLNVEVVAWDQPGGGVPMEAALTPQAAIERGLAKPSECEIVVAILWSRMGTPLPAEDYTKPDGTPYASGTEWEILDALEAGAAPGPPSVWIYRRTEVPNPPFDAPDYEERRAQWERVNAFFARFQGEGGAIRGGINEYETPSDFRDQFEQHLRDKLTRLLPSPAEPGVPASVEDAIPDVGWAGNPYPGLEAFSAAEADIFFGRAAEVDALLDTVAKAEPRFVAVVGGSGCGKSSLVRAGLIPRLRAGAIRGSERWMEVCFKPRERGGDPMLALAYPFKQALGISGVSEAALANELRADPTVLSTRCQAASGPTGTPRDVLIFVDQFEELFPRVDRDAGTRSDESVSRFTALLAEAARTPGVRVVATLRSDFFERAVDDRNLESLFRGNGTFTLTRPGVGAMRDMIVRPARMAGIEIEERLVQRLLDDTAGAPGGLALLAFALSELYREAGATGSLTLHDYEAAIGGVDGAIKRRAEAALKTAGAVPSHALERLFEALVEVDQRDVATRRRAALDRLTADTDMNRLLNALVEARLLVIPEDTDPPQVEVAHEAVFSAWPRLERWIEANASNLRVLRSLEQAAKEWEEAGAPALSQLPDRAALKRYATVRDRASDLAKRFHAAGRRRQRLWRAGITVAVIAFLAISFDGWLATEERTWNSVRIWAIANADWYGGPEMIEIRPGEANFPESFEMGSHDGAPDERPVHPVTLSRPFRIGRFEVSFDEYGAFTLARGIEQPDDRGWGVGSRPVINVSWDDAQAYIVWLREATGKRYRLPTEAEWEYAARAGSITPYWWGDDIHQDGKVWANCRGCGSEWDGERTAPVGEFPPNDFGLHDTAGNVWEWVEDCWHKDYTDAPADGSAWGEAGGGKCGLRVLRGGSWGGVPGKLRSAGRGRFYRASWDGLVGFRLAQDVD